MKIMMIFAQMLKINHLFLKKLLQLSQNLIKYFSMRLLSAVFNSFLWLNTKQGGLLYEGETISEANVRKM